MWMKPAAMMILCALASCVGRVPGDTTSEGEGEGEVGEGEGEGEVGEGEGEGEVGEGEGEVGEGEGEGEACVVSAECDVRACFEARCLDDVCVYVADLRDVDHDFFTCPDDCDDNDDGVSPTNVEACADGKDNDCDGDIDDADADCVVDCFGEWCFESAIYDEVDYDDAVAVEGGVWFVARAGFVFFDGSDVRVTRVAVDGRGVEVKALWAAAANDIWGVGRDLVHFDGVAWSVVEVDVDLNDVDGGDDGTVWLVGNGGRVRHGRIDGFVDINSGTTDDLRAVHVDDLGRVVIAGVNDLLRGGVGGFTLLKRFDIGRDGGIGLDDVDGELFVVMQDLLYRETQGFTTPAAFPDGDVANVVARAADDVWIATSSGVQRYDGSGLLVGVEVGDRLEFDGPRGRFHLTADGDDFFVATADARVFVVEGEHARAELTTVPNRLPFGSISVLDANDGNDNSYIGWALRGNNQLWRHDIDAGWLFDRQLPFGADTVLTLASNDVWILGDTRTGHLHDGVLDVTTQTFTGGCANDAGAWALRDGQLVQLTTAGVVAERSGRAFIDRLACAGDEVVLVSGLLGLARRVDADTVHSMGIGRLQQMWSVGNEVRMPLFGNVEVRISDTAATTNDMPGAPLRYVGRAADDSWVVEDGVVSHVGSNGVDGSVVVNDFVRSADVSGEALFAIVSGQLLRITTSGSDVIIDGQFLQHIVMSERGDGFAIDSRGDVVRFDSAALLPLGGLDNTFFVGGDVADDGDLWIAVQRSVNGRRELVHFDDSGEVERFVDVAGPIVAYNDDDVWIGGDGVRHLGADGVEVIVSPGDAYFSELVRLDGGVVASTGDVVYPRLVIARSPDDVTEVPVMNSVIALVDDDAGLVIVNSYGRAARNSGEVLRLLDDDDAALALDGRAMVVPTLDPFDGHSRLVQWRDSGLIDADTTLRVFPSREFEHSELPTTTAGVQLVRSERGGLLVRRLTVP
jgi:hypothetical protein